MELSKLHQQKYLQPMKTSKETILTHYKVGSRLYIELSKSHHQNYLQPIQTPKLEMLLTLCHITLFDS